MFRHFSSSIRRYATYKSFKGANQTPSFTTLLTDSTSKKYLAVVFGFGGLFYVTHLEEAPVSGRTRFIWIPHGLERKIGDYSYREIMGETRGKILPDRHPLTLKVARIFQRILDVTEGVDPNIEWKIHIVNDPHAPPNAFVLPGGKVFVFSSILGICANEDGLATVLSHEFAHQLARHTAENLSKAPAYSLLSFLMYALTGADVFNGVLLNTLCKLPASRAMESEADYIGLMMMSKACFNPDEAVRLWARMAEFEKRMANRGGLSQAEFLSTHPSSTTRIHNIESWLPQAHKLRDEAHCSTWGSYYQGFQDFLRH